MKKTIVLVTFLFCLLRLGAQNWSLDLGNPTPAFSMRDRGVVANTLFIGCDTQSSCLLRHDANTDQYRLELFDNSQHALMATADLPSSQVDKRRKKVLLDVTYAGGYGNEGSVDLLSVERSETEYQVLHRAYDSRTLQPIGNPQPLASYQLHESDKADLMLRESASGEWIGVIYYTQINDIVDTRVSLYDTRFEEMWSMDFTMAVANDYLVTDEGEVLFCGKQRNVGTGKTEIEFVVLDGDNERPYFCEIDQDSLLSIDMLRYENGCFYCTGLIEGERQDKDGGWASGFYVLVFDSKSGTVTHFEKHYFSHQDVKRLCNVDDRTPLKISTTDGLHYASSRSDAEGSTVIYDRTYRYSINGVPKFYYHTGLLVVRLDAQGHMKWSNIVRRHIQSNLGNSRAVNTKILHEGGRDVLVYHDMEKNADVAPDRPLSLTMVERLGVSLVALSIDAAGNTSRQYISLPRGVLCIGAPHALGDGAYLMLMTHPRNSYFAILKYRQ